MTQYTALQHTRRDKKDIVSRPPKQRITSSQRIVQGRCCSRTSTQIVDPAKISCCAAGNDYDLIHAVLVALLYDWGSTVPEVLRLRIPLLRTWNRLIQLHSQIYWHTFWSDWSLNIPCQAQCWCNWVPLMQAYAQSGCEPVLLVAFMTESI